MMNVGLAECRKVLPNLVPLPVHFEEADFDLLLVHFLTQEEDFIVAQGAAARFVDPNDFEFP